MSRLNKVNRDRYMQAGRLTPDEMARERLRQKPRERQEMRARVTVRTRSAAAPPVERASSRRRNGRGERE
jgi:hypothetical protein